MISFKKNVAEISSRQKWLILGILIALVNPIFAGLIISFGFITEPTLRKEGKIVLAVSLVWSVILAMIMNWLKNGGYL
ncbi:MAG: hypothetical protein V1686_01385 [Patescibacteria group bacterium]